MSLPTRNIASDALMAFPCFAFTYGNRPSAELLPTWSYESRVEKLDDARVRETRCWSDPVSGLQVIAEVTRFTDFPAVDWLLYFRNTGAADTPILEAIHTLAATFTAKGDATLHYCHGSDCVEDFLPREKKISCWPGQTFELAPQGGRSSNGTLPFFNLTWPEGGGIVGAIGWSGQWALQVERGKEDATALMLRAGQQTTHLTLHTGEQIRSPRMLLLAWDGDDLLLGHNQFRQLLLKHYLPRIHGELAMTPVTQNTWFMFNEGNEVTEDNQLAIMPSMADLGLEGYWLDAGWFEGGWPNGAGSWVPKPDAFPRGLRPLGDEAHRLGMTFVLWFEPERVTAISRVAHEYPEWVMHHPEDGDWGRLFDLGNPAAQAWLTDYLSQCFSAWGVDVFRNDFNIDPLPFWRHADALDRQGMAEIRYIEGLYAMWDTLRARHPGLTIDNCASGGRRIDLETTMRSYPLWQSDSQCCGKSLPVNDQVQNGGLSLYIPLHSAGVWGLDAYSFRSIATTAVSLCLDIRGDKEAIAQAKRMIAELKSLRPFYLGDYYPLLPIRLGEDGWCGWQYHRTDLDAGFFVCFRRALSPFIRAEFALRGLNPQQDYRLTHADTGVICRVSGADLGAGYLLEITEKAQVVLLRYAAEQ